MKRRCTECAGKDFCRAAIIFFPLGAHVFWIIWHANRKKFVVLQYQASRCADTQYGIGLNLKTNDDTQIRFLSNRLGCSGNELRAASSRIGQGKSRPGLQIKYRGSQYLESAGRDSIRHQFESRQL